MQGKWRTLNESGYSFTAMYRHTYILVTDRAYLYTATYLNGLKMHCSAEVSYQLAFSYTWSASTRQLSLGSRAGKMSSKDLQVSNTNLLRSFNAGESSCVHPSLYSLDLQQSSVNSDLHYGATYTWQNLYPRRPIFHSSIITPWRKNNLD